jgi:hypothetical protein
MVHVRAQLAIIYPERARPLQYARRASRTGTGIPESGPRVRGRSSGMIRNFVSKILSSFTTYLVCGGAAINDTVYESTE